MTDTKEVNQAQEVEVEVEGQATDDVETKQQEDEKIGEKIEITQDELNELIQKRVAREKRKYEEQLESLQKEQEEAEKLAKMNAEEKAQYEREKDKQTIKELKSRLNKIGMQAEAKTMLSEHDIRLDDNLLNVLVRDTAEETKEAVNSFVKAFNEAVNVKTNEKLRGKTPQSTRGQVRLTKEEIMKIKNDDERKLAIANNQDLFK